MSPNTSSIIPLPINTPVIFSHLGINLTVELPPLFSPSVSTISNPHSSIDPSIPDNNSELPLPTDTSASITYSHVTLHYPMVTRSEAGTSKLKAYTTINSSSQSILEHVIVSKALLDPRWKTAMQLEFDALIGKHTFRCYTW